MRNRFPCICRSGVGKRLKWNQLSGDQLISTQSISPQLFLEVLSPQLTALFCLLLPKLSTLVDFCLGWVVQYLQAFCMSLAAHCHHIVVVPSLSSNCRCPITILKLLSLSPLLYYVDDSIVVILMAACDDGSSPLPSTGRARCAPLSLPPTTTTTIR
jgi:hypothetical protein